MLNLDEIRFLLYGTDFYDSSKHFEENHNMILSGCHIHYKNAKFKTITESNKNRHVACFWDDFLKIKLIQQDLENYEQ